MPKVMAVSWNGGMVPLAAVKKASSDQSSTATKPIRVALRCDKGWDMNSLHEDAAVLPRAGAEAKRRLVAGMRPGLPNFAGP